MTMHELLELASLDALGLLDDLEREEFERAFQAAPPALQAQVRREQARLARAEALLPDVEAPASLRARVLAAVREAITAVHARRGIAGRLPLLPSRGVTPIWRAAAIGCAAAALIFGFTTLQIRNEVHKINDLIEANASDAEWVREYGARFRQMFFDPDTTHVQFANASTPVARAATDAKAAMMVDQDGTAYLFARDLPENPSGYALVALNADGSMGAPILTFNTVPGAGFNERIPTQTYAAAAGRTLAIVRQTRDGINVSDAVLRSKSG